MEKLNDKKKIRRLLDVVKKEALYMKDEKVYCDFSYMDENYRLKSRSIACCSQKHEPSSIEKKVLNNLDEQRKVEYFLRCINQIPIKTTRLVFIGYFLFGRSAMELARLYYVSVETIYRYLNEAQQEFWWRL